MKNLPRFLLGLICTLFAITASAQVPQQATNFQIDATHSGATSTETLTPPLRQRWVVDFGWPVSYPLIADGKVFVTVKNVPITSGTTLYALDATNGSMLWSSHLGGFSFWGAACYENGRVFALNGSGVLRSFDGATGNLQWTVQLPGGFTFAAPPTVFQGVIYVSGPGAVHAVDAVSGAVNWSTPVTSGDKSSPVVTSDGVYVSYSGPNVYKLDPATGAQIWNYPGGFGAGGRTPVFYNGALYVRTSDFNPDAIFDGETGAIIGSFNMGNLPVFADNMSFYLDGSFLHAHDVTTNFFLWAFTGDESLQSAMLVVNNYLYVGSAQGNLYAVDTATGQQVWVTNTGAGIPVVDEDTTSQPLTGFAAGEGLLVVPTSTKLIAYEGDTVAPTLTFGDPVPAANAAGWNNTAVDISFTTADDFSGVQSSDPASPLHFASEGANQTQQVTVTDNAGNSATFTSPAVNIDFTQPLTSALVSGPALNQQWFNGPVSVTLSASDNLSGVANRFYRVDGGAVQTYTSPFSITSAGTHSVEFWSVDVAGNSGTHQTQIVRIDATAPVVTASANPATAPKRPQPVNVTISGSVTDAVSGVGSASFNVIDEYGVTQPSGSVTVQPNGSYSFILTLPATKNGGDKDGHLYTIVVTGVDQAGNSVSVTTTFRVT